MWIFSVSKQKLVDTGCNIALLHCRCWEKKMVLCTFNSDKKMAYKTFRNCHLLVIIMAKKQSWGDMDMLSPKFALYSRKKEYKRTANVPPIIWSQKFGGFSCFQSNWVCYSLYRDLLIGDYIYIFSSFSYLSSVYCKKNV